MNVKEYLISKGMDEKEDFARHESDLYVRVTPVSKEWLKSYPFKNNVSTFVDSIEGVLWYDVPFAAFDEQQKERAESGKKLLKFIKSKSK